MIYFYLERLDDLLLDDDDLEPEDLLPDERELLRALEPDDLPDERELLRAFEPDDLLDDPELLYEGEEEPELDFLFTDGLLEEPLDLYLDELLLLLDLYVGDELPDDLFETFDREDLADELGFVALYILLLDFLPELLVDPEAFEFVLDALLLLVYVLLFAADDLDERVEFTVPVLRDDLVEFVLMFEGNLELRVDTDEGDAADLDETELLNDALDEASCDLLVFDAYLELATVERRLLRL
ncbi:MAG: hypothetical protein PF588_05100 [Candidatus Kapabacteria bacterium]|nr:hypothetical protein [Candidatus Kapabacteria bacterium]